MAHLQSLRRHGMAKAEQIMRTDQEIIDQTNVLARSLYAIRGYAVREGYRFDSATHPHEVEAWRGACEAQMLLTDTDPRDALDEIEKNAEVRHGAKDADLD